MPLMVSPRLIVYRVGRAVTGVPAVAPRSLSTCPGKISDFQPRPLTASTDAVETP
jgi:hypothetical protein